MVVVVQDMNLVDDGQSGAQTPNSAQASWLRGAGAQGLRHRHSFDQNNHRELYNWEDMQVRKGRVGSWLWIHRFLIWFMDGMGRIKEEAGLFPENVK